MTVDDATNKQWAATIEALIFASEKPVREAELRNHIPDDVELAPLISAIHKRFDETSGIELCQVGDSWAFRTRAEIAAHLNTCLLYTSPSPRDMRRSRMPSSA